MTNHAQSMVATGSLAPTGFAEDYQAFSAKAVTGGTPLELPLNRRNGTATLIIEEVSVFINAYTPAAGTNAGDVIELHWAATSGAVSSAADSTTRLAEFVYECQSVVAPAGKESTSKLWLKASISGEYQVTVKYFWKA
jgi:hypothetical protein